MAIALHNMAMCLISLNDFPRSLDCYQKSRELSERYGMPLLRDQADYNIAYLYYFRGEYSRAIEMLFATRRACEITGDAYHLALCHLDLSEIYLELNLSEEAREMAHEGFRRFEKLGMLRCNGSRFRVARELAGRVIEPPEGLARGLVGGFVGYLGYECKADCGSPNVHRSALPDATMMLANRVYILNNGLIVESLSAEAVRANPEVLHRHLGV